jgi:RNA polymerase sigma-70 factor (ECF subfamily)
MEARVSHDEARTPVTAGELFEQHHLAIYRYFCRMVQHPATAEDLVQETFVRVVKSLPRYRPMGRDTAWVFRIASHALADHFARRDIRFISLSASADPGADSHAVLALGLDEALNLLPPPERDAFVLREVVGLSYVDIAEAMGISAEGVRAKLRRARLQMRRLLAGWRSAKPRSSW